MNDRIPAEGKAGRVLITPENGSAPFYATVTMADEPLQEGTPLHKATLLKDSTAALLGGGADMVPDDALVALKVLIDGLTPAKIGASHIVHGTVAGTATNTVVVNVPFYPQLIFVSGIYVRPSDSVKFYTGVISGPVSGFGLSFYNFESEDYIFPARTTVTESNGIYRVEITVENTNFYNHPYNYVVVG